MPGLGFYTDRSLIDGSSRTVTTKGHPLWYPALFLSAETTTLIGLPGMTGCTGFGATRLWDRLRLDDNLS